MLGTKGREFAPLPPASLEQLVPPDDSYRHLERSLDLSFVRDLVRDASADNARPSIDPAVVFKLQLVLFFEGLCAALRPPAHAWWPTGSAGGRGSAGSCGRAKSRGHQIRHGRECRRRRRSARPRQRAAA